MRYVMIVVLMLGSLAVAENPECQKARETIGEISPAVIMGEWNQTEVLAVLSQLESCQINAIRENDGEAAVEAAIAENALLVDMYNRTIEDLKAHKKAPSCIATSHVGFSTMPCRNPDQIQAKQSKARKASMHPAVQDAR